MATHLGQPTFAGQPNFPQMLDTYPVASGSADLQRETKQAYNGTGATLLLGKTVVVDRTISTALAPLGKAVKLTTTDDDSEFAGIVENDIPTGTWGTVVIKGVKPGALVAADVVAGDPLQVSDTTGTLEKTASLTEKVVARALTAYSATLGDATVCITPGCA